MSADNVLVFPAADPPIQCPTQRPTLGPAPRVGEPLWREVVGRELRRRRQEAGRTLSDVADAAGVSTQYLSEIERGLKEPSSEILRAVNGALGLRLADLTGDVSRTLGGSSTGDPTGRRPDSGAADGPVCLAS